MAHTPKLWIATADKQLYTRPAPDDIARQRVQRFLQSRGPRSIYDIHDETGLPYSQVEAVLQYLLTNRLVVKGQLIVGRDEELWCDRQNYAELYRRAIAARRAATRVADRTQFYRFLLRWHQPGSGNVDLLNLARQYQGLMMPLHLFEREILPSRGAAGSSVAERLQRWQQHIQHGDVVIQGQQAGEDRRRYVRLLLRGQGHLFYSRQELYAHRSDEQSSTAGAIVEFLRENGASFMRDLVAGTGLSAQQIKDGLTELTTAGLVSCDHYPSFMAIFHPNTSSTVAPKSGQDRSWDRPDWLPAMSRASRGYDAYRQRKRRVGRSIRESLQVESQLQEGRWFLLTAFAVMGREIAPDKRVEQQARLLLQRYGILVKEWYRREMGLALWYPIFQALKRLEWQGEIRRGYFIEGLSGVQFATNEAVDLLEKLNARPPAPLPALALSTLDPALPFGQSVAWDLVDRAGAAVTVVRALTNHLIFGHDQPLVYSENIGSRLTFLQDFQYEQIEGVIQVIKQWLHLPEAIRPRRKIEISQIDNQPATKSELADTFLANGFERQGERLVLWPSGL